MTQLPLLPNYAGRARLERKLTERTAHNLADRRVTGGTSRAPPI
jgi:hypothetical protein